MTIGQLIIDILGVTAIALVLFMLALGVWSQIVGDERDAADKRERDAYYRGKSERES